jgi:hypothetical protein
MPRITLWDNTEESSENLDFCRHCMANGDAMRMALREFGRTYSPAAGDTCEVADPADHPDYDDYGDYTCENCGRVLTDGDN